MSGPVVAAPVATPVAAPAVAVIAALAIAGCAARAPAPPPGEAAIAPVQVVGAASVDRDELLDGLGLTRARREGLPFDPYLARTDEARIRGFYLRRGFFNVQVRSRIREQAGRVAVTFVVEEGPRARLARVELAGVPLDAGLGFDDLRPLVPLRDGTPYRHEPYVEAFPPLLAALQRAGYCHATLDGTVTADVVRHEAVMRFEVTAGPRCRYGEVTIAGIDGPLADAARARIRRHVRPGRRYSSTELAEAQADLYAMQRFAAVRIEPFEGDDPVVPIRFTVVEATRHEVRLGGGVGIDPANYEARTRAGYRVAGWPRPLMTSRAEVRPAWVVMRDFDRSEPRIEAVIATERLDLFRPMLIADAEASIAVLRYEAYSTVGPRVRLGARSPLGWRWLHAAVGWQLAALAFRDLDPAVSAEVAADLGLDRAYRLGFFEQRLIADLRDDPVAPRLGGYAELRAEEGTRAAGGAFRYLRLTPELRGYVPLGPVVLAARARVGAVIGELPATQRYFSGGSARHRGFAERRLAPEATAIVDGETRAVVIGGGGLVEAGLEARIALGTVRGLDLGGTVFLDGGDVTHRLGDVDLGRLHWAAGIGLRVQTVIGAVRFDVGYRLNRYDGDRLELGRLAYHLGIGEAF